MRIVSVLTLVSMAALVSAQGQNVPAKPALPAGPAVAAPATAPAPPKPTKVDFSIPLKPIKQADLSFAMLKNRNSLLFYFSPNCGHCQHTYPIIKSFRDKYEKKGMAFAAIAIGYASPEDIKSFDAEFKLDLLAFQDDTKRFAQLYSTGSVPLMLLVTADGSFQSWNASDSATLAAVEAGIKKNLKIK